MKHLFFIAQILLVTLGAYMVVELIYQNMISQPDSRIQDIQALTGRPAAAENPARQAIGPKKYTVIADRNLFNVLAASPEPDKVPPLAAPEKPLEKTNLQLALWGTVTAASENMSYAVIENKKTREQSLFQAGDEVEGATIRKIDRSRVILRVNGQDQILEVEITRTPSALSKSALPEPQTAGPQTATSLQEQMETGIPALMKQARIRPFFSDGKPDGLLLYGIRNDSVFQQIGLRNGDIIRSINGSDTLSAQDAVTIYQSLDASLEDISDIRFTILRRGKTQEIVYNAQNNDYTVETVSDE
ncbi:MAG: type II secretion system protein N [Desulfotignum sp.]|jgi:general secretion pathway protein C|nr:type II secretion system protein N [Desulfotignum sp.]